MEEAALQEGLAAVVVEGKVEAGAWPGPVAVPRLVAGEEGVASLPHHRAEVPAGVASSLSR